MMKNDEYISKALILSKCDELWNKADETTELGRGVINAIDEITDYIETLYTTNQTWENNSDSTSEMTLEEAYKHIEASYMHHINERNAIFLPQAESIAMDCIQKVIDAQNLKQCIVEHDISFDAFCIYCQDLLNSAKERLERTLSCGETSEYRISELKSAIKLQEQLLNYMKELKEAKKLLKIALDDMNTLYESGKDDGCLGIKFKWRYENEVLRLVGDDINVSIDEN